MNEQIEKTIVNLKKNQMDCFYLENRNNVLNFLDEFIKDQSLVSVGGSQTLFELGIIDYLRRRNVEFLDRYSPNLSSEDLKHVFRQSFFSDVYLTSTNAITEDGWLYNVDGRGNRVAAMIYGPDKVLVIAGVNKIVKDLNEAEERVKSTAAPLNANRLKQKTPCINTGYCMDCESKDRICYESVIIKKSIPNRITILLINENLGF